MSVEYPGSVSTGESQPPNYSPSFTLGNSLDSTTTGHLYNILDKRESKCALVLFAQSILSFWSEQIVIKILREYKDTRYSLATLGERQHCQLEALRRNRIFTPETYIGLVPVHQYDLDQGWIEIGDVIELPTKDLLDPDREYALLMHRLPEDRRLDALLKDKYSLRQHVQILTEHIAHVHTQIISPISNGECEYWGSYEQVYSKLLHNLALLDLVSTVSTNARDYSTEDTLDTNWFKETLLRVFSQEQYRIYFEQRVQNQRIKHCHGDMKAPNIWILPYNHSAFGLSEQYVKVLDAIDFNPSYCTIDILSDFAMLVIDVQARTGSASLANEMIEEYLDLTNQKDEISRSVLNYYLVEKAIAIAAVSIIYDGQSHFGANLLTVAQMWLECLLAMQQPTPQPSLLTQLRGKPRQYIL